jgi:hypothetical protein
MATSPVFAGVVRRDASGIDCPIAEHARRLPSVDSARRASA